MRSRATIAAFDAECVALTGIVQTLTPVDLARSDQLRAVDTPRTHRAHRRQFPDPQLMNLSSSFDHRVIER